MVSTKKVVDYKGVLFFFFFWFVFLLFDIPASLGETNNGFGANAAIHVFIAEFSFNGISYNYLSPAEIQ